jgi:hypothetical protein
MLSNIISINKQAPIYPKGYLDEVKTLVTKIFAGMLPKEAEHLLCKVYNVESLSCMVDEEEILSDYDYQPSVSSDELEELRARIEPIITKYFGDISKRDQIFYVRNIVNCVPKELEDLSDYITSSLLASINIHYHKHSVDNSYCPAEYFYSDDELESYAKRVMAVSGQHIKEVSPEPDAFDSSQVSSYLEITGMLAMDSFSKEGLISNDIGFTHRQKYLTRAAQYYTLARYHYPTAKLWLSGFISAQGFCGCSDKNCGGRAFGFTDLRGSGELVLQSLEFIERVTDNKDSIALADGITVRDIDKSNIERTVYGAESLIMSDPLDEHGTKIAKILAVSYKYKHLMSIETRSRLCIIGFGFITLYGDKIADVIGLTVDDIYDMYVSSVAEFYEVVKTQEAMPEKINRILFDCQGFYAAGTSIDSMKEGLRLQLIMFCSQYRAKCYQEVVDYISNTFEDWDMNDLPDFIPRLFNGYLNNFSSILAEKSIATTLLNEVLFDNTSEDSNVIKILSEKGHYNSMRFRLNSSNTKFERAYWESRLVASSL